MLVRRRGRWSKVLHIRMAQSYGEARNATFLENYKSCLPQWSTALIGFEQSTLLYAMLFLGRFLKWLWYFMSILARSYIGDASYPLLDAISPKLPRYAHPTSCSSFANDCGCRDVRIPNVA